jgi:ABC-type glutathione transport system ATPase component
VSLLAVEGLSIGFPGGPDVVDRASFSLEAGESLGVLGASGSGKSLTALALMGLLPPSAEIRAGSIRLDGEDLLTLDPERRRRLRGGDLGLVFQEPFTAMNPLMRVGTQIEECLRLHQGMGAAAARGGARTRGHRPRRRPGPPVSAPVFGGHAPAGPPGHGAGR